MTLLDLLICCPNIFFKVFEMSLKEAENDLSKGPLYNLLPSNMKAVKVRKSVCIYSNLNPKSLSLIQKQLIN